MELTAMLIILFLIALFNLFVFVKSYIVILKIIENMQKTDESGESRREEDESER